MGIMLYLMKMFSTVQEAEDDEHTEGDGSSTDGYPKDKKTCFMCNEHFSTYHKLKQHQVMCKNKQKCPNCPITGAAYNLVKNFMCHTELCDGEGLFKCLCCAKVFTQYDVARNHKYYCPIKCTCHICNFTAKTPEAMKTHVNKCHKKFTCKKCNYHCLDSGMLTCHIQAQ